MTTPATTSEGWSWARYSREAAVTTSSPHDDPLADVPGPARRDQRVEAADQEAGQHGDGQRRHGEARPGAEHLDLVGPGPLQVAGRRGRQVDHEQPGDQPDEQVPPPPHRHQDDEVDQPEHVDGAGGGQHAGHLGDRGQRRRCAARRWPGGRGCPPRRRTPTLSVRTTAVQLSRTAPLRASHHLPDGARWRGSGGGSPEGRRRRRTRLIAGGAGRAGRPTSEACVVAAMSPDAPPVGRTGPRPLVPSLGPARGLAWPGAPTGAAGHRLPGGVRDAPPRAGRRAPPARRRAPRLRRLRRRPPVAAGRDDPRRLLRLHGEPDPRRGLRGRAAAGRPGRRGAARRRHPGGGPAGAGAGRGRRRRGLPRHRDRVPRPRRGHRAARRRRPARRPHADPRPAGHDRPRRRGGRGPERLRRAGPGRRRAGDHPALRPRPRWPPG